jgi:hypothetical protein
LPRRRSRRSSRRRHAAAAVPHKKDSAKDGKISIALGRGHPLGPVACRVTLVALLSVLRTGNMAERGRGILDGLTILAILLAYGS